VVDEPGVVLLGVVVAAPGAVVDVVAPVCGREASEGTLG
jgi:hypothetical protein